MGCVQWPPCLLTFMLDARIDFVLQQHLYMYGTNVQKIISYHFSSLIFSLNAMIPLEFINLIQV